MKNVSLSLFTIKKAYSQLTTKFYWKRKMMKTNNCSKKHTYLYLLVIHETFYHKLFQIIQQRLKSTMCFLPLNSGLWKSRLSRGFVLTIFGALCCLFRTFSAVSVLNLSTEKEFI